MALEKQIETQYGIDATYWRLTQIQIDYANESAAATLSGYPSQSARQRSALHISHRNYRFSSDNFSGFGHEANNTAVAYQKIREHGDTRVYDQEGVLISGKAGEFSNAKSI